MSPRRRIEPDEPEYFTAPPPRPPRRLGLPLTAGAAAVVIAAAITASSLMLWQHETDRRTEVRSAAALSYARGFMTAYTSLDPFNANAYADRILEQGTGEFAGMFQERYNEIVIQVAQAEPTAGRVLEAGVQRWSEDGSADVLVAVKTTSKSPDGKQTFESGSRWIATVVEEGRQWKISNLVQVI